MEPSGRPDPIPLTVVTGFLGAGKTTLLNRLLKTPEAADSVVLINEFGQEALDHLLVEAIDGDIVTLAGGCLCCMVRDDLMAVLEDLLRRRDNGRIAPFRRLIVETTGLADPAPLLQTAARHPYLSLRYVIDGVITVVDARNGAAILAGQPEARRQVQFADRIVLTRTDAASGDQLAAVREALTALNPDAPCLDAAMGEATPGNLFGIAPMTGTTDAPRWLEAGNTAHDDGVKSTVLWRDQPLPDGALPLLTELLASAYGDRILRLKGLVALASDPSRPMVIHGVQHVFEPPRRLDAWPGEDRRSHIVVIGRELDENLLSRMYDAFAGVRPGS